MKTGRNYSSTQYKAFQKSVSGNPTDPGKRLGKLDGINTNPRLCFFTLTNKKPGKHCLFTVCLLFCVWPRLELFLKCSYFGPKTEARCSYKSVLINKKSVYVKKAFYLIPLKNKAFVIFNNNNEPRI